MNFHAINKVILSLKKGDLVDLKYQKQQNKKTINARLIFGHYTWDDNGHPEFIQAYVILSQDMSKNPPAFFSASPRDIEIKYLKSIKLVEPISTLYEN